jgi:hypothetical protein
MSVLRQEIGLQTLTISDDEDTDIIPFLGYAPTRIRFDNIGLGILFPHLFLSNQNTSFEIFSSVVFVVSGPAIGFTLPQAIDSVLNLVYDLGEIDSLTLISFFLTSRSKTTFARLRNLFSIDGKSSTA